MLQATSLMNSMQGEPSVNLEQAIVHLQKVLEVINQDRPEHWAIAQNILGEAYRNLSLYKERTKNLDRALHHYNHALEVTTRQDDPDLWGAVHNNRGIAYANGASGDQSANLEKAIHHCQQALIVYTREDFPDDWAMVQNNLGSAYRRRALGCRCGRNSGTPGTYPGDRR